MTDRPIPRRKVTGQITISSTSSSPAPPAPVTSHGLTSNPNSTSSPSNPPTRIRAKVDPSSLPLAAGTSNNGQGYGGGGGGSITPRTSAGSSTSTGPGYGSSSGSGTAAGNGFGFNRPTLRSTPSSNSLRSGVSASSSRARSPAPPLPSASPISTPGSYGGRSTPTAATVTASTRPGFRATASQNNTPTATSTPIQGRRPPSSSGRSSPVKDQTQTPTATATARIRSSAVTQNAFGGGPGPRTPMIIGGGGGTRGTGGYGGSGGTTGDGDMDDGFKKPAARVSDPDGPRIKAKITNALPPTPITPGDKIPSKSLPVGIRVEERLSATVPPSPHLSPPPTFETKNSPLSNTSAGGNTSEVPQSPSFAQHAMYSQIQLHPTASAPGSPLRSSSPLFPQRSASIKAKHRRPLPYNPAVHPPHLPPAPMSPEMRTVELPLMTPTRSREDISRRPSLANSLEYTSTTAATGQGVLLQFEQYDQVQVGQTTLSGSTTVAEPAEIDLGEEGEEGEGESRVDDEIDEVELALETEEDVKEAKTNRKIADLEITNASLLAINRSLEATKSKQRSEIMKLRRMLRESLSGNKTGLTPLIPSYLTSIGSEDVIQDTGEDEEMHNPELDARWDRIADMVDRMKFKGMTAVEKGKEEIKTGAVGRVLDWTEVEGLNSSRGSWAGTPELDRERERERSINIETDQPGEV